MRFEWVITFGNMISLATAVGVAVRAWYSVQARLDVFDVWRKDLERRQADSAGHFREMDTRVEQRIREMSELMEQTSSVILRTSAVLEQVEKRLSRLENQHDILHQTKGRG